jgi:hypothetical protein
MDEPSVVAVGTLAPQGAWIGFVRLRDGFHVVCGDPDGSRALSTSRGLTRSDELLTVAIAHYEEALNPPPSEHEATQADLAGLLRWLADAEPDPGRRAALVEAVDAIDDGLAADAVVGRLSGARALTESGTAPPGASNEQADLVDLLVTLCASIAEAAASA